MELCKEEFREWVALKSIEERIPQFFQHGLTKAPLHLTCIDAYTDHLVIGTNIGLVYVVHLPSYDIIKLKTKSLSYILCISAVKSVDEMIAIGCEKGEITIFQKHPFNQSSFLFPQDDATGNPSKSHIPRRFSLCLHKTSISSMVWSKNGMKLFSGDIEGNICLCEIDFEKSECIGMFLLKVNTQVVQLSYSHQILAVSDLESCILYDVKSKNKTAVGKRPQHPSGYFGCVFSPCPEFPKQDVLYCVRSPSKIWSANIDGQVTFTYIQRILPIDARIHIDSISALSCDKEKIVFNYLLHVKDSTLVSFSKKSLYIIDVKQQNIIGFCTGFSDIRGVALEGNSIIILDKNRDLICLSPTLPHYGSQVPNNMSQSMFAPLQESLNLPTISKFASKLQIPSKIVEGINKIGSNVVSKLNEIAEPHIIQGSVQCASKERNSDTSLDNTYNSETDITTIAADDALQTEKECSDVENAKMSQREMREYSCNGMTDQTLDDAEKDYGNAAISKMSNSNDTLSYTNDNKTYEELKHSIEENENFLANVLNLKCLTVDHPREPVIREVLGEHSGLVVPDSSFGRPIEDDQRELLCYGPSEDSINQSLLAGNSSMLVKTNEASKLSSSFITPNKSGSHINIGNKKETSLKILHAKESDIMPTPDKLLWNWDRHRIPVKPFGLLGNGMALFITEYQNKTNVYLSFDFGADVILESCWMKLLFADGLSSFSFRENDMVVQTLRGHIYVLDWINLGTVGDCNEKFLLEESEALSSYLAGEFLWVLNRSGRVVVYFLSKPAKKKVVVSGDDDQCLFKDLVVASGVVWALTTTGQILYRIGISQEVCTGFDWGKMEHSNPVVNIHVNPNGLGFMVDSLGGFHVAFQVREKYPQGLDGKWWQLGLDKELMDILMKNSSLASRTNERTPSNILLSSNNSYLFLSKVDLPVVFSLPLRSILGHRFTHSSVTENLSFNSICGKGIVNCCGILYCIDDSGLYAMSPQLDWIVSFKLPRKEKIVLVSSYRDALWILCESGRIFNRTGISGSSIRGVKWEPLNLQQIDDILITHLSVSSDVVWVVDSFGRVYMRQGNLQSPNGSLNGLHPAWLQIDTEEIIDNAVLIKVFVGHESDMVWAIDSSYRVYVRADIFPDFATGARWVNVSGLRAISITLSGDRVFAVSYEQRVAEESCGVVHGGFIYERVGVSSDDFAGSAWQMYPSGSVIFKDVTVSVDNTLWGLSVDGKVLQHSSRHFQSDFSERRTSETFNPSLDPEEWELV